MSDHTQPTPRVPAPTDARLAPINGEVREKLHKAARRRVGEHAADDLTQETLLQLTIALRQGKWDPAKGTIHQFAHGVLTNVVNNHRQKCRRRSKRARAVELAFEHLAANDVGSVDDLDPELIERVEAQLPPAEREVFRRLLAYETSDEIIAELRMCPADHASDVATKGQKAMHSPSRLHFPSADQSRDANASRWN